MVGRVEQAAFVADRMSGINMRAGNPPLGDRLCCGMGPAIAHDAQSKILSVDGVDEADVQLVWDPPWNQNMISEAGRMKLGMI